MSEERELLERRANQTRERLLETIEALDQRRQQLFDVRGQIAEQVKRNAVPLAVLAGATALLIGGGITLALRNAMTRRRNRPLERLKALARYWEHPERLAARAPVEERSVVAEVGRKILAGSLIFLVLELTKRSLKQLVERPADTRVVARPALNPPKGEG